MRLGAVILLLLATASVGLLVGCASEEGRSLAGAGPEPSSSSPSADAKQSADTSPSAPAARKRGKVDKAERSRSVPAVAEMSVFSRPRTEADVLPSELSYRVHPHACTEWDRDHFGCMGDPIPEESRVLLSGLGVRQTSLFAWPTTNGWVCWAWAEGGGGCTPDFTHHQSRAVFMGIDPDHLGVGYPGTLVGVVPDDVAAADVQVQGVRHAATVQHNGIFYELPDGSCTNWAFESLTVMYRDGGFDTVPIKWHSRQTRLASGRLLYPAGELNPPCKD